MVSLRNCGLLAICFLLIHCKDEFQPSWLAIVPKSLVVEGFINMQPGTITTIHLSRTSKPSEAVQIIHEKGAIVKIEVEGWQSYPLKEADNGTYVSTELNMDSGRRCRLLIHTSDGNKYESDYLTPTAAPPIDSIGYLPRDGGAQIYVSSSDPSGNTRYYRWEFEATFEYHSRAYSKLVFENGQLKARSYDQMEQMYTCWKTDKSTKILLGSSVSNTKDVISQAPLDFIPPTDIRLGVRYSILVRQYALSKKAYEFWKAIGSNSEELGGFFGNIPTEIISNINCKSDPKQQVVGYICASKVSEKRVFFNRPGYWRYFTNCEVDTLINSPLTIQTLFSQGHSIAYSYLSGGRDSSRIEYARDAKCADCRLRGGSGEKPDFWQ